MSMKMDGKYGPIFLNIHYNPKENKHYLVCHIGGQKKEILISEQVEELIRITKVDFLKNEENLK